MIPSNTPAGWTAVVSGALAAYALFICALDRLEKCATRVFQLFANVAKAYYGYRLKCAQLRAQFRAQVQNMDHPPDGPSG